jgi:hypothetical protein
MYDKGQNLSKTPSPAIFSTVLDLKKIQQQQQQHYQAVSSIIQQHKLNTTLQSLYANYFNQLTAPILTQQQTETNNIEIKSQFSPISATVMPLDTTIAQQHNNQLNTEILKLSRFYENVPFKCPYCLTFKEASFDLISHLANKHFKDIKSVFENGQLKRTTNNEQTNSATTNDLPMDPTLAGSQQQSSKLNKQPNEPKPVEKTKSTDNDYHISKKLCSSNKSLNGHMTSSPNVEIRLPANGHETLDINKDALLNYYTSLYELNAQRSMPYNVNDLQVNLNQKHEQQVGNSNGSAQHQQYSLLRPSQSTISSMHCALCNRGFEYYSNLRRHIKTKHKIFGKEIKEYVVRHVNQLTTNMTLFNKQHISLTKNSDHVVNVTNMSQKEDKNKDSSMSSDEDCDDVLDLMRSANGRVAMNSPRTESVNRFYTVKIVDSQAFTKIYMCTNCDHECDSQEVMDRHVLDIHKDIVYQPQLLTDQSASATTTMENGLQTAKTTTTSATTCTSPLSVASSSSSSLSKTTVHNSSSNHFDNKFSLSNLSSCMNTKFKTNLLEAILTRKLPTQQQQEQQAQSIDEPLDLNIGKKHNQEQILVLDNNPVKYFENNIKSILQTFVQSAASSSLMQPCHVQNGLESKSTDGTTTTAHTVNSDMVADGEATVNKDDDDYCCNDDSDHLMDDDYPDENDNSNCSSIGNKNKKDIFVNGDNNSSIANGVVVSNNGSSSSSMSNSSGGGGGQIRFTAEVWRCPYCCYETSSASRYNSHLVSLIIVVVVAHAENLSCLFFCFINYYFFVERYVTVGSRICVPIVVQDQIDCRTCART